MGKPQPIPWTIVCFHVLLWQTITFSPEDRPIDEPWVDEPQMVTPRTPPSKKKRSRSTVSDKAVIFGWWFRSTISSEFLLTVVVCPKCRNPSTGLQAVICGRQQEPCAYGGLRSLEFCLRGLPGRPSTASSFAHYHLLPPGIWHMLFRRTATAKVCLQQVQQRQKVYVEVNC